MKLEDLEIYQTAMEIGENVWGYVEKWDYLAKDTIGKQLLRSVDSIAANMAEGYGRYHYKENKNFNYYARGSLYETRVWLRKAYNRNLIKQEAFDLLTDNLDLLGRRLNKYINSIGQQ